MQDKFLTKKRSLNDGSNIYIKFNIDTINDKRLSPMALVTLMHIFTSSDEFIINKKQLMRKCRIGINAMDNIFKELIANEYMIGVVYKSKDHEGRYISNSFNDGSFSRKNTGIEYMAFEHRATHAEKSLKFEEFVDFMEMKNPAYIFECLPCKYTQKVMNIQPHGIHSYEIHNSGQAPIYNYKYSIYRNFSLNNECENKYNTHAREKKRILNVEEGKKQELSPPMLATQSMLATQPPPPIESSKETASHEEDRVERAMEFDRYDEYVNSYGGPLVAINERLHQIDCKEYGASFMKECYLFLAYFKLQQKQRNSKKIFNDDHFMLHDWVIHKIMGKKRIESFSRHNSIVKRENARAPEIVEGEDPRAQNDFNRIMDENPYLKEQTNLAVKKREEAAKQKG